MDFMAKSRNAVTRFEVNALLDIIEKNDISSAQSLIALKFFGKGT